VFERAAPKALERVNRLIHSREVGQGNTTREINDQLLDELAAAYREAAVVTRA
jgi:(p)ppGpp synthase/HD superfamily hydrolase